MAWTITPIRTGVIKANKALTLTLGRNPEMWVEIPATAWLLRGGDALVLVDTGMCDTERAGRYHYPGSRQEEEERIDRALLKQGVSPEEVEIVIHTHLHWDHSHNQRFFKKARFYVQRKELQFAMAPLPPYYRSYESVALGARPPFIDTLYELLDGEGEIVPGVRVFPTPGHSPGHQAVAVETGKGAYVVAGDAVMCWENWAGDPEHKLPFIMNGRYMDLEETWLSFCRIEEVADFVLPGHEARVFEKSRYP